MASLLIGEIAPIDFGDGSGMNLMDIRSKTWSEKAVAATAPDLLKKLPPLVESWKIVGLISPYFVQKFALSPKTRIVAWSGDNLNSLVGLGLVKEGEAAASLGTSFTYFGYLKECHFDLKGESHLFAAPIGDYMYLICFRNGALAIEALRRHYSLDWEGFNQALTKSPPGNRGKILLPYFEPEIVPHISKPRLHRFDLAEEDIPGNCRAIVEAQMLSMRLHSEWMGIERSRIYATGGVSINPLILQTAADVCNCPVIQLSVSKSSSLGAALRAAHGYLTDQGSSPSWEEVVKGFIPPLFTREIRPNPHSVPLYDKLIEKYAACEQLAIRQ